MKNLKTQQNQKLSNQLKIFDQIYKRKYSNQNIAELVQRRRIIASQFKPKKPSFIQTFQQYALQSFKSKSKTVGSLLPKLKEIQLITKSEKPNQQKLRSNSLSKLQVYLSDKNIKRQQQFNMLFITQNNSVIPDRIINEKFCQFVAVNNEQKPKNLRALLSLTGGFQLSQQGKKRKISQNKQQITSIMKAMIQEHHKQQHKNEQQIQQNQNQQDHQNQHIQSQQNKVKQKEKGIEWVLKQCKKYNKKFRVDKKKSKSKKKINEQNKLTH